MSYPSDTAATLTAPLSFTGIVEQLRATFRAFPDHRKPGNNTRYTLEDAGLSAFSSNSRYPPGIRASQACRRFDFYGYNHTPQALKACPNAA